MIDDEGGLWFPVSCADDRLRGMYMRHYSSAKSRRVGVPATPGQMRIVGPGETLAMLTADGRAGFIWRLTQFRGDGQKGVECSFYRNEGGNGCKNSTHAHNSTRQIAEAVEAAYRKWGHVRLFTYVNPEKIASSNPGYCFQLAGFKLDPTPSPKGLRVLYMDAS